MIDIKPLVKAKCVAKHYRAKIHDSYVRMYVLKTTYVRLSDVYVHKITYVQYKSTLRAVCHSQTARNGTNEQMFRLRVSAGIQVRAAQSHHSTTRELCSKI